MTIAPAILEHFPGLSPSQQAVIGHLDGPLLVIAGPGSGKWDFRVTTPPEVAICKECDLQMLCHNEGIVPRL